MQTILEALGEQVAVLDSMLAPLDEAAWQRSSPCEGWTVADVVLHLAQTNELAAASARGELATSAAGQRWASHGESSAATTDPAGTVDDLAGAAVERERGEPGVRVRERWKRATDEMVAALAECGASDRLQWVVGDMAARTLATTRLAETWIHTGDVAEGLGVDDPPPGQRLWHIARLAHRTVPYALARAGRELSGPVAFRLTSPADPSEVWAFGDEGAATTISGPALDLCRVAAQRVRAADTALQAEGPDAAAVLELVRTYA